MSNVKSRPAAKIHGDLTLNSFQNACWMLEVGRSLENVLSTPTVLVFTCIVYKFPTFQLLLSS